MNDEEMIPVCAGCYEPRPLVGWLSRGGLHGRACSRCANVIKQDVTKSDAFPVRVHPATEEVDR